MHSKQKKAMFEMGFNELSLIGDFIIGLFEKLHFSLNKHDTIAGGLFNKHSFHTIRQK